MNSLTKLLVLITIFLFSVSATTQAVYQTSQAIGSGSTIISYELRIYTDETGFQEVTEISWNEVYPNRGLVAGEVRSVQLWFKVNLENSVLDMTYGNFLPVEATDFITYTWNYAGEILEPDMMYPFYLTIHVSPDINGTEIPNFHNTMWFTATVA